MSLATIATEFNTVNGLIIPPQGRLTVATGSPVVTSTDSANTTVYYAPYIGRRMPLYDGVRWTQHDFGGELSQATTDNTKSPAAVANSSNYDIFGWLDAGTYRATRGPAWSSDTSRGTGAGTTELEYVEGVLVNKIAITNGPAAQRGTYLGSVRSNGSAQVDWIYGAIAAGGTAGSFGVWNMYNRVDVQSFVGDSVDSFSVDTSIGQDGANMQFSFLSGLAEDCFDAAYHILANASGSAFSTNGIGYDSTASYVSGCNTGYTAASTFNSMIARYGTTALGWHSVHALNLSVAGTATFYSDAGVPTQLQAGMWFRFKM
jgi:hypothetical protein